MCIQKGCGLLLIAIATSYAAPIAAEESADTATPVFWADDHTGASKKITQALRSPLSGLGLEFQDTDLSEVADFIRNEYSLEVQLDLAALDDLGISPDDPITVNLRNISLGAALRIMLRQLDLTYIISDEVLLITSVEESLSRLKVAVYPVGDLLDFEYPNGEDAGDVSSPNENDSDDTQPKSPGVQPGNIDSLIDVIISCVASDTWVENGGPEAEIRPIQPGLLVVSQTAEVHEQIAQLLRALREAKSHEFAIAHKSGGSLPDPCRALRERAEEAEAMAAYFRQAIERRRERLDDSDREVDQRGGGMF